jgi:hypothetical protein
VYHTYYCENAGVKLEFTIHSYLAQILDTATPAVELKHSVNIKALVITGAPTDRRWSLTEPRTRSSKAALSTAVLGMLIVKKHL